jgi:nucleotide-binding universal stress UspA family protein
MTESTASVDRIVVGVDESVGARMALQWAFREGQLRGGAVTAVLAWGFLDQHPATGSGTGFDPDYDESDALAALDHIVTQALDETAETLVERRPVCDLPAKALLGEAEGADLLVLGARGVGGFRGLLLGSVSQQCLHHAKVPTVVVRNEAPGQGVVVGVDGSPGSRTALRWAVDEARRRNASLTVVHAYAVAPFGLAPYSMTTTDSSIVAKAAEEVLDDSLEDLDLEGLSVMRMTSAGGGASALIDLSESAELVVVGARGAGLLERMLLGSVATQVVHHASCPVAVIPHDD